MKTYSLLFSLLFLAGCAEREFAPPPVDLDAFAPILADAMVAQSLTAEVPTVLRDSMRGVYLQRSLEVYGMDTTAFDSLMYLLRREPHWVDSAFSRAGVVLARRAARRKVKMD